MECGDIYHRVFCIRRALVGEITRSLLLSKVKQQVHLEIICGSGLMNFKVFFLLQLSILMSSRAQLILGKPYLGSVVIVTNNLRASTLCMDFLK